MLHEVALSNGILRSEASRRSRCFLVQSLSTDGVVLSPFQDLRTAKSFSQLTRAGTSGGWSYSGVSPSDIFPWFFAEKRKRWTSSEWGI